MTFERNATGAGGEEPTAVTVTLFALVWLPAALRLIALTGGGVKTSLFEASSPGIIDALRRLPEELKREALPTVVAALRLAEQQGSGPNEPARSLRQGLERELEATPVGAPGDTEASCKGRATVRLLGRLWR